MLNLRYNLRIINLLILELTYNKFKWLIHRMQNYTKQLILRKKKISSVCKSFYTSFLLSSASLIYMNYSAFSRQLYINNDKFFGVFCHTSRESARRKCAKDRKFSAFSTSRKINSYIYIFNLYIYILIYIYIYI